MAAPRAPPITEFARTFLADEDEVDGVGALVVGLEPVVVGFVVVGLFG